MMGQPQFNTNPSYMVQPGISPGSQTIGQPQGAPPGAGGINPQMLQMLAALAMKGQGGGAPMPPQMPMARPQQVGPAQGLPLQHILAGLAQRPHALGAY